MRQMQTLFEDGDKDVSRDYDPYLRLDGVLARTQKN